MMLAPVVMLSAVLAATSPRSSEAEWHFGATPWFAVGHSWGSWPSEANERRGLGIELNAMVLVVVPGDRFAFGVTGGLLTLGLRPVMGDTVGPKDLDLWGLQVLPTVMVQLFDILSLHARGGYVFAGLTSGSTEASAGAVRFGGGVTLIAIQTSVANIGFQLEVLRTQQVSATPMGAFAATTVSVGVGIGFNPDLN